MPIEVLAVLLQVPVVKSAPVVVPNVAAREIDHPRMKFDKKEATKAKTEGLGFKIPSIFRPRLKISKNQQNIQLKARHLYKDQ